MSGEAHFTHVGDLKDVQSGRSAAFTVAGQSIVVFNDGGDLFAVENRCPHQDAPLLGAPIRNGRVRCMLHGWLFNLRDCQEDDDLMRFPVKVDNGRLLLSAMALPADQPA